MDVEPVEKVVASIKHHTNLTFCNVAEITTDDALEHRLVDILLTESQRTCTEEIGNASRWLLDIYINNLSALIDGIRLRVGVDGGTEHVVHRSPHPALQGIHIRIGVVGAEHDDAVIVIIIDQTCLLQECSEPDILSIRFRNTTKGK